MFLEIFSSVIANGFFGSLAFGITALVLVGGSWCLVGLVMSDAPKRGVDTSLVQFFGSFTSVIISLIIGLYTSSFFVNIPLKIFLLTCCSYFVAGFMNFHMLQTMSKAMQKGPNGVIWAIIQAGCVSPFICGMLFFNVEFTILRVLGIVFVVLALILFVFTKDNTNKGGSLWLIQAFICFGIVSIQQNLMVIPSYYEECKQISSVIRAMCVAGGTLIGAITLNLFKNSPEQKKKIVSNLKNSMLWKYVFLLQFFSLIFAYTLHYPGMDVMANHGRGGMSYPLMVGSCIVFFTILSIALLKERIKLIQIAALAACIAGLSLICT